MRADFELVDGGRGALRGDDGFFKRELESLYLVARSYFFPFPFPPAERGGGNPASTIRGEEVKKKLLPG